MSILYFLLQGAVASALRDKIMPSNNYSLHQLPMPSAKKNEYNTTRSVIEVTESYSKTELGMSHKELANTLYDILCEDKVLRVYSIQEDNGTTPNYFKITKNEKEFHVSITVCTYKEDEGKIRHRMEWVLYCLPYVKKQFVDFTVDEPYIPFADGCGCMFF